MLVVLVVLLLAVGVAGGADAAMQWQSQVHNPKEPVEGKDGAARLTSRRRGRATNGLSVLGRTAAARGVYFTAPMALPSPLTSRNASVPGLTQGHVESAGLAATGTRDWTYDKAARKFPTADRLVPSTIPGVGLAVEYGWVFGRRWSRRGLFRAPQDSGSVGKVVC